jgi:hypothetical protein
MRLLLDIGEVIVHCDIVGKLHLTSHHATLLIFEVNRDILHYRKEGRLLMEYQELYSEYNSLLRDKTEYHNSLALLKDGYISTKTISGNKYAYLQYRVNGKLFSKYIKDDYLPTIRAELEKRAALISRIQEIGERLEKIEAAAKILDKNLSRRLVILRRCAAMEMLTFEEREKSLAFGSAMTALEGIPSSAETEKNLSRWVNGDLSFRESYLNTLRAYHLAEV